MKKIILLSACLSMMLTACPSEKTKESIETDIKNTTENVKSKLNDIDKKAAQKTEEFSEQVKETSKDLGNKMEQGIQNTKEKAKDALDVKDTNKDGN